MSRVSSSASVAVLLLGLLAAGSGCTRSSVPLVTAEGKVTFDDGQPLPENTMLVFSPTSGQVGDAFALVAADGSFRLQRAGGGKGAPPGHYVICLRAPPNAPSGFYEQFHPSYLDGTLLSVTVAPGMSRIELSVKRKA